jgi:hypothetical protein
MVLATWSPRQWQKVGAIISAELEHEKRKSAVRGNYQGDHEDFGLAGEEAAGPGEEVGEGPDNSHRVDLPRDQGRGGQRGRAALQRTRKRRRIPGEVGKTTEGLRAVARGNEGLNVESRVN